MTRGRRRDEPPLIEMERRGGPGGVRRYRMARDGRPPPPADLPFWARLGFMIPLRTELLLTLAATLAALVGAVVLFALLFAGFG